MSVAISLRNVVKTFGSSRALDGLDLEVATGEVHAYLGPNGAGKTVTIRTLLGLLRPDSGEARLLDGDPWRDAVELHRRIAYVPGDVNLWPSLSGGEIIDMLGRFRVGSTRADATSSWTDSNSIRARRAAPTPGQSAESRARGRACLGR